MNLFGFVQTSESFDPRRVSKNSAQMLLFFDVPERIANDSDIIEHHTTARSKRNFMVVP
jgi:hypothetical protein